MSFAYMVTRMQVDDDANRGVGGERFMLYRLRRQLICEQRGWVVENRNLATV